jgi:hypothetical protein
MADVKSKYGTSNQTITITIASLANSGARSSTVVDNSSNRFVDVLIQLKVKSASSSTSATGTVNIYAYGTVDGGTSYPEGAGTDTGITLTVPTNLRLVGVINVVANSTTYISSPMSVAGAFGGVLPDHWGIVLENKTGAALDATGGNHSAVYQGVYAEVA